MWGQRAHERYAEKGGNNGEKSAGGRKRSRNPLETLTSCMLTFVHALWQEVEKMEKSWGVCLHCLLAAVETKRATHYNTRKSDALKKNWRSTRRVAGRNLYR